MEQTKFHDEIIKKAKPFSNPEDLGPIIDLIAHKKVVMLGEASHGTKEFYDLRTAISKELILNHGFKFIAVEGDWPPCQKVNHYIHNKETESVYEILSHFSRWPTWMWANHEIVELLRWLKFYNYNNQSPVSFHGLDVYSLYESMDQVVRQLKKIDPELSERATYYYSCFDSYRHDEKAYARSLFKIPDGCKQSVLNVLNETLEAKLQITMEHQEALFDATQNARIACHAEKYYRAMVFGEEDSWNVRDNHMMETLDMLMKHYGPDTKAIVWEHNTHIGDYKATDMLEAGQVNIGGLAREKYGEHNVALVGFSTYSGTVVASHAWDGPIEVMTMPNAAQGSVEEVCHQVSNKINSPNFFMVLNRESEFSPLNEIRGHRAIGVVYHPTSERRGNYVPTLLADRYDALIFLDKTHALNPLKVGVDVDKFPETYPFGSRI